MANCLFLLPSFLLAFASSHIVVPSLKNPDSVLGFWLAQAPSFDQRIEKGSPPLVPEPRRPDIGAEARAYLILGRELFSANRYNEALRYFEAAIDLSPNWGDPYLYKGLSLASQQRLADAELALEKAVNDPNLGDSDRVWAYAIRGSIANQRNDFRNAEAHLKAALGIDPDDITSKNILAYVYSVEGKNLEQALELINDVLSRRPDMFEYVDTRGWIYYRKGDYKKAEKDVLTSLKLAYESDVGTNPWSKRVMSEIHYHLGEIYLAQNKDSLARTQLQKSLEFDADNKLAERALEKLVRGY